MLGRSKIIDHDSAPTLLNKFQKELTKLGKENKFDNKTFQTVFYGVIKAHKPEKNYPMRTIVSTMGTAPYGTSKYLVVIF